ncbi:TatD family hydrolase [Zymobacter sp. IVIA_5232.4 C2]|uniref:TatD family hydrolase n=1 Tax=Zymobacter sp. IVIA_5232.4 C2 TaxID=3394855 RepID=UPI0039C0CF92
MLPDTLTFHSAGPLVDIGANLTHESYARDLPAVLERAATAGVSAIVLTGTDEASIEQNIAIMERHAGDESLPLLRATAGIHPHDANHWSPNIERLLRDVLRRDDIAAVGECGLDYFRDYTPRDQQRHAFEMQLALAAEYGLPLFLHEREAGPDMLDMLTHWRDDIHQAVVHCFTGDRKTLYGYLDLDLHIGITGWICDERRGQHLHPLIKEIPAHRLMIETDCPYLLPRDLPASPKARRHEPALLPWISRTLARLVDEPEDVLAQRTTETATAFFSLPEQTLHLPARARASQEH